MYNDYSLYAPYYRPDAQPAQSPYQGAAHAPYGAYPAYYQAPMQPALARNDVSRDLLGFANDRFMKGILIGAAATYLLTNDAVQRSAIKGVVQVWGMIQGGLEEVKERFHDAEAEIQAAHTGKVAE